MPQLPTTSEQQARYQRLARQFARRRREASFSTPPDEPTARRDELPLISAILPTRPARRHFLAQALRLFCAQDYPHKELLILEDDEQAPASPPLAALHLPDLPTGHSIHYCYHVGERRLSVGEKRNRLCAEAGGDLVVLWDDDDYFGPGRLSLQAAPILAGEADVTGLRMPFLLRASDASLWRPTPATHRALFPFDLRCGTLMFRASYWHEQGARYDAVDRGEDMRFLQALLARGARLIALDAPAGTYVCVRHGDNTSDEIVGLGPPGWEQVPLSAGVPPAHLPFYEGLAPTAAAQARAAAQAHSSAATPPPPQQEEGVDAP